MNVIENLNQNHKSFVLYVKKNAITDQQRKNPEDVVQDAYVKLLEEIRKRQSKGETIEFPTYSSLKTYFFKTIKSIMINQAQKKTIHELPIKGEIASQDVNNIEVIEHSELVKKINQVVETFYWYDKMMFNLYRYKIPSIRKISSETKISRPSVTGTIKKCKYKIQKELATEYYKLVN